MPSAVFPVLVSRTLDSILLFILEAGSKIVTNEFLFQVTKYQDRHFGIQQLLLPHLFNDDFEIRGKSFVILLKAWLLFPANAVDPNATGIMYTLLYTLTWIFASIEMEFIRKPHVSVYNCYP